MTKKIVVVEQLADWKTDIPAIEVVLLDDYLTDPQWARARRTQVINLCRSYKYLGVGYYCSLLAMARGHRVIPSVRTMLDLANRPDAVMLTKALSAIPGKPSRSQLDNEATATIRQLDILFGTSSDPQFANWGRKLFEIFPCPLLRVRFEDRQGARRVTSIRAMGLHQLKKAQRDAFGVALVNYLGRRWRSGRLRRWGRFDLAILHNPEEQLAPSDPVALRRFVKAGIALGLDVDLITGRDFGRLAEYDALFIRETTQVAHHTFRFAKKAESEGLVVIDDPTSILRCTNKVYLAEIMRANGIPAPITLVVGRGDVDAVEDQLPYPMVLKMPEGSFSSGVFKVKNRAELHETAERLFRSSELILAQAYTYTPFDWRIGILDRRPLYASKYFMSKRHWQIVRHQANGRYQSGDAETIAVEEVPGEVLDVALKAAGLIGDGLYGVDLKQTEQGVVVIEVNDNPSIDGGVEDRFLGQALYHRIMEEFLRRIERSRAG
jgi:glutathione synthase/RimK-type ligase-like ATP-grasp enzyme